MISSAYGFTDTGWQRCPKASWRFNIDAHTLFPKKFCQFRTGTRFEARTSRGTILSFLKFSVPHKNGRFSSVYFSVIGSPKKHSFHEYLVISLYELLLYLIFVLKFIYICFKKGNSVSPHPLLLILYETDLTDTY